MWPNLLQQPGHHALVAIHASRWIVGGVRSARRSPTMTFSMQSRIPFMGWALCHTGDHQHDHKCTGLHGPPEAFALYCRRSPVFQVTVLDATNTCRQGFTARTPVE